MAQGTGSATTLAVGLEASFGVIGASNKIYPYVPTLTLNETQNLVDSNVMRSTRDMAESSGGFITANGSFGVPLDTKLSPTWLYLAMGSVATTGASPYTHTITKHDTTLPSIFLEKRHEDVSRYYLGTGFRINGFTLDFSGEGEATMELDLVGKEVAHSATEALTPTSAVEGGYFGKFEGDIAGLGCVTAFNLSYTNNLQADSRCISSTAGGRISDIPLGMVDVSGSFTVQFTDVTTTEDDARALNNVPITATYSDGTDTMTFQIQEALLTPTDNGSVSTPQGLEQTYDFKAYWKVGSNASALTVIAVNDVATVTV